MSNHQMSLVETEKSLAVFSSVHNANISSMSTESNNLDQTNNLIHESGRLQLNSYQAFIKSLMDPRSDFQSLMLVHMTGTGKTITALATATEYVRQYQPSVESVASIVVIGFTKDIFKKELLSHPEFLFVNMDEANELKDLEREMHDSAAIAERYESKKRLYNRRLLKREIKGIYQFYGYKQFANRVINMEDVKSMILKQTKSDEIDVNDFDTIAIRNWIDSGDVRINTNFIRSLSRSLFICDEVHNLYKTNSFNTYGLAIHIVFRYFTKTLPTTDIAYGSIRSLLLSATPLTTSALEIIPIITLLTGEEYKQSDLFKSVDGVDQLIPIGLDKIRKSISGKISYIMDDNPKEYPKTIFEGESIKGIDYIKFIRTVPIGTQLKSFQAWEYRENGVDKKGSNMIKDIVFPAIDDYPNGVIFSKNIKDLSDLRDSVAVRRSTDGLLISNIFQKKLLKNYSCKYEKLVNMCLDMKDLNHGKMFIYHPFVQGSGTELIMSILLANGFVQDGDQILKDSICMHCNTNYGSHELITSHKFNPVRFTFITGSLSKNVVASRLNAFNNDQNTYGERIKIIIGSRAMRESHTLKACRHVIIAHEPSSISEMVQIIGRAVRKHVHSDLPQSKRSVQIHILTTNVESIKSSREDITSNEEFAYRKKVLQYKQINRIDRIMYDVSIDYLINFRFKLRETPQLLGETYPLDTKAYGEYEKILTKAYADIRNGITSHGIHTTRFNVFYFEGEVRLVMMILKRIILSFQPMISISQIKDLVRNPPFNVEYNTKLISNESIAVAINRLSFKQEQMRLILPLNQSSIVDTLFDKSSLLIDTNGIKYRIICIGEPLCNESYLIKKSISSILDGDNSIIDSFRNEYSAKLDTQIDLEALSVQWANTIDINDVINDLIVEWESKNIANLKHILNRLPIDAHILLVEWIIKYAVSVAFKTKLSKTIDTNLICFVIDFYKSTKLLFTICDLKHTRIYNRYKRYDVNTGSSWFSKNSKPSTATLPIGHVVGDTIRIYEPVEMSWLELNSISEVSEKKHPYGFYIYEERVKNTLKVVLKVRYDKDINARGITMIFLQTNEIQKIANKLNVKIKSFKYKQEIISRIEEAASAIQIKLHPKRLIYKLIDL